ncbi:MAG: RND transporter, partial [Variovorax sp.]
MNAMPLRSIAAAMALAGLLGGCAVGPVYQRPLAADAAAWRGAPAAEGWLPAAPADLLDRGPWWRLFGDADLDRLVERVEVSNQNIAIAVANYAQAQALVREQRATLFPSLSLSGGASRSGTRNSERDAATGSANVSLGASWTPDVWGRLGLAVGSAQAQA